jgi:CheY-like chemotaxis protein
MTTTPKLLIVEDKEEDLEEALDCLGEAGFTRDDIIGAPNTYEDALGLLNSRASEVDLVLLDLNLPRNEDDARPEKGHGRRLLDHVHNLNRRPQIHIRVIVVSAETLDESWDKEPLLTQYAGTLLGFAQKAELIETLNSALCAYGRDPLRDEIIRVDAGVEGHYDKITDPNEPIRERLEEACALAIQLLRNDMDFTYKNPTASVAYAD